MVQCKRNAMYLLYFLQYNYLIAACINFLASKNEQALPIYINHSTSFFEYASTNTCAKI